MGTTEKENKKTRPVDEMFTRHASHFNSKKATVHATETSTMTCPTLAGFGFDVIEDSENTKQMLQDMHSSDVLGEAAGVGSTSPPSRGWHRVSSGASAGASSSLIMEDDGIVEEDLDL